VFPQDGRTLEELLKNGDLAMYRAKEQGRGRAVFYEPEMQSRVAVHSERITALHRAVKERQFQLHYQPIVSAADGRLLGAEALMRWYANGVQFCGPDDFIPVAEETGLIVEMGSWALQEACRQMALWHEQGLVMPYVSVNVSARQLHDENFAATLAELLRSYDLQPSEMQIEIVERVIAEGTAVEKVLRDVAAMGVRLALDDFGTGYSSLSYLRTFPIHCVKIDRSFIKDIPQDTEACTLVETIIVMARTLQKYCVAEGVETAEQRDFLNSRGCEGLQGYFFSKPKPVREFTAMLLPAPDAARSQRYA
jgi:EAL domain-containing protein (putative c-di-GMP-specific phosphodiesterase class I)